MKISDAVVHFTSEHATPLVPGCLCVHEASEEIGLLVENRDTFAIVRTKTGEESFYHSQLYVFRRDFVPVTTPVTAAADPEPLTRETDLLDNFAPHVAAALQLEGATLAALVRDGFVFHSLLEELLMTDASEKWTPFDYVEELRKRLAEGEDNDRTAFAWADEFMGPVSDAIERATGRRSFGMTDLRKRIIDDYTNGIVGKSAAPAEDTADTIPINAAVAGVAISPFHIGGKKLWRIIDQLDAVIEGMKKARPDDAGDLGRTWKHAVDSAQEMLAELDNLDGEWTA